MPPVPQLSFQQLSHILEAYKDHVAPVVYNAISNVLNSARDNADNVMLSVIQWTIVNSISGVKSVREITNAFSEKTQTVETAHCNQYILLMNSIYQGQEGEALG
jgi:hypothetical protein